MTRIIALALLAGALVGAQSPSESGTVLVSLIDRPVGKETFEIKADATGLTFTGNLDLTERNGRLQLGSMMRLGADLAPSQFSAKGKSYRFVNVDASVDVVDGVAKVTNLGSTKSFELPKRYFTAMSYSPLSARALLIRYWERNDKPATLAVVPGEPTREVRIEYRGEDTVKAAGRPVKLRRYSVSGIVWGSETVWLDETGRFAAIVSRIHILPLEGVRDDLKDALPELQRSSIQDRMNDLARARKQISPVAEGVVVLRGARLIDGTGRAPVDDAVVIIRRDGRIGAAGPRRSVVIPAGARTLDVTGMTMAPGLWDMHAHAAQIEWLTAYLAAGVTTIRDMGGEEPFLVAMRDSIAQRRGLGARVLLAGLVDGDAPAAFGSVVGATPEQGRAIVDRYHAAGFQQMKLYNLVQPNVVSAIVARAHELNMSVTGHVPNALGIRGAIEAGMDHVAHMPINGNPDSPQNRELIAMMAKRKTVIDPTLPWNELLNHAPETSIESFEPGITHAPPPLKMNYLSVKNDVDAATAASRLNAQEKLLKAMFDAGVPIVASTDGGLPGYSLLRSLEMYVDAGLTPMQAIESATRVAAQAMGMDKDAGTIEAGKRADLIVLTADPLASISNIRKLKWVIADGRVLDPSALWQSAGFK